MISDDDDDKDRVVSSKGEGEKNMYRRMTGI